MTFNEAIERIQSVLALIGTTIDKNVYDGIIVKKLEASNTLDDGRTTNQTHIAITGVQMDIFPYLRSDGYLKKYFITQVPMILTKSNVEYLDGNSEGSNISFTSDKKRSATSVVRGKRRAQADQIQVSLINFDGEDFIAFRRLLHAGSYLIILKKHQLFEYECYGVIPNRGIDEDGGLQELNNQFFKLATNTRVNVEMLGEIDYDYADRITGGTNILLYGVPGSGKSWTIEHEYCNEDIIVDRLVFHPDYTNSDFVGQILPVVDEDKQVTYEFTPGPFTTILSNAYRNPMSKYILIIEEINRGNAPAIFGEVFQLLDRKVNMQEGDDGFPVGTSEYGITHKHMSEFIYGKPSHKVRIPSNLSIIGTMNTSDQNVFTLDTAFQRRWQMRLIENNFDNVRPSLANAEILDTDVTWKRFCETVNTIIVGNKAKMASAEDKRLGVYFVHENDLTFDQIALPSEGHATLLVEYNSLLGSERLGTITAEQKSRLKEIREAVMHNRLFPEKVIKYLWDDAFKFNPEALFDTERFQSLEDVIRAFVYTSKGKDRFNILKPTVRQLLYPDNQQ